MTLSIANLCVFKAMLTDNIEPATVSWPSQRCPLERILTPPLVRGGTPEFRMSCCAPAQVEAMRRLVAFMVGETNPTDQDEFGIERGSLASLCLWQLVSGYQVRPSARFSRHGLAQQ